MFRYFSALFLTIFLVDLAISILETRRVPVIGDVVLKRNTSPIGYWVMASLWLIIALGSVVGVPYLTYLAFTFTGPFVQHDFFSMHQAWPYALTTLVFGWLALKIVRRRMFPNRHDSDAA